MIFLVDILRSLSKTDLTSSVKPSEMVRREPIYLESGRMACVPAWEQDLIEQREEWFKRQGERRVKFAAKTEAIIADVLESKGA